MPSWIDGTPLKNVAGSARFALSSARISGGIEAAGGRRASSSHIWDEEV